MPEKIIKTVQDQTARMQPSVAAFMLLIMHARMRCAFLEPTHAARLGALIHSFLEPMRIAICSNQGVIGMELPEGHENIYAPWPVLSGGADGIIFLHKGKINTRIQWRLGSGIEYGMHCSSKEEIPDVLEKYEKEIFAARSRHVRGQLRAFFIQNALDPGEDLGGMLAIDLPRTDHLGCSKENCCVDASAKKIVRVAVIGPEKESLQPWLNGWLEKDYGDIETLYQKGNEYFDSSYADIIIAITPERGWRTQERANIKKIYAHTGRIIIIGKSSVLEQELADCSGQGNYVQKDADTSYEDIHAAICDSVVRAPSAVIEEVPEKYVRAQEEKIIEKKLSFSAVNRAMLSKKPGKNIAQSIMKKPSFLMEIFILLCMGCGMSAYIDSPLYKVPIMCALVGRIYLRYYQFTQAWLRKRPWKYVRDDRHWCWLFEKIPKK